MKKAIAGIVLFIGVLFILGAVGSMEYSNEMSWGEFFIRTGVGSAVCTTSVLYLKHLEDKEDKES